MEYLVLIYRDESKDGEVKWGQARPGVRGVRRRGRAGRGDARGKKLQPSATATTVAVRAGERLVSDGPFAETRAQLGGFFVLEYLGRADH
ncbi:YciI family protein [Streptomyces sp. NPDC007355]|uniref:YciI family protein n=1 Tax=Streptomyces sp. NPDC007355 TaxID=3364778 RepID=UPI00368ABBC1